MAGFTPAPVSAGPYAAPGPSQILTKAGAHEREFSQRNKCFLGIPEPRQNKVPCGFWAWQDSPLHFTFLNHNIPLLWYVSGFPVSARATGAHKKAQFLLWFCTSCCLPRASSARPHHRARAPSSFVSARWSLHSELAPLVPDPQRVYAAPGQWGPCRRPRRRAPPKCAF